jgi:hypothetical protein
MTVSFFLTTVVAMTGRDHCGLCFNSVGKQWGGKQPKMREMRVESKNVSGPSSDMNLPRKLERFKGCILHLATSAHAV